MLAGDDGTPDPHHGNDAHSDANCVHRLPEALPATTDDRLRDRCVAQCHEE